MGAIWTCLVFESKVEVVIALLGALDSLNWRIFPIRDRLCPEVLYNKLTLITL